MGAFYFEIHADAGFAHDVKTGENKPALVRYNIGFKTETTEDVKDQLTEEKALQMLALQLKISPDLIRAITHEEYYMAVEQEV